MVRALPDSVGVKDVKAVIANRLKVVVMDNTAMPIHSTDTDHLKVVVEYNEAPICSTGTDIDKGTFFVEIDREMECQEPYPWAKRAQEALPWLATREVCHLLERDWVKIFGIKTIVSLSAAILSTVVLGWGLLLSACATVAANIVTHAIVSHRAENRADDFANKHCSAQECEKAIAYLESVRDFKSQEGIAASVKETVLSAFRPSEDARIAKIRKTLSLVENRTPA